MRVLLTTEGTYPYIRGGVSTWADMMVRGLPQHEFTVVAIVANPPSGQFYELPPGVELLTVPLWGFELLEEYLPLTSGARRARRTTDQAIRKHLLPAIDELLEQVLVAVGDPERIGSALVSLADFSVGYDLRLGMRDERVWALMLERFRSNPLYLHTNLGEAFELARSLFRYLVPLTIPLPDVDVVHSSAAAFCVFPGIVAKLRSGTPLVLSEHGIYLRERILDLVRNDIRMLGKTMFSNLYRGIGNAAYRFADHVVPVCVYNTHWELALGVDAEKVGVVYNGVEPTAFAPAVQPPSGPPTVAYVGRLDPLKDLLTLVRAARLVLRDLPEVRFRIFGPDTDPAYAERCRRTVEELGLTGSITFEGPTDDPPSAYRAADVVVLSSMSEGFPFTVVEAMMCGRTVVATSVGGVAEAIGEPSLLAEPQDAASLAAALLRQLRRPQEERERQGGALRARAMSLFTRQRLLEQYDQLYERSRAVVR